MRHSKTKEEYSTENRSVQKNEVPVDELFSIPRGSNIPVLAPLVETLPYSELHPGTFESLCAHVVDAASELDIQQAFRYGVSGQSQAEADIIAVRKSDGRHVIVQCKRYKVVTPGKIKEWVQAFLKGQWVGTSCKYILCIAANVQKTKQVAAWLEAAAECAKVGIDAELWGADVLDLRLRTMPTTVAQFFSRTHAELFCAGLPADAYPSRFRTRFEASFEHQLTLEDESVSISFNLPHERFQNFGAIFNFARADLSGISFAVGGDMLVNWLQWRLIPGTILR
ncbi:hypothetical protein [Paraburkholderia elongata]|uniref:Restriction endonuclease type IV Mrr domain-containing protein n=1 Tax=Paraburkholderia elongata TaxID=2675747 RepID=A0A972NZ37_9BURK|nr:hypothetical protein [Paraburkholderia elongata]NPT61164.1 hypothetical protein [Paraburkholderia elongata]